VLVLRDVLGFRAAEVAEMLDGSEASVNGALNRARSAIATRLPAGGRAEAPLPRSPQERELVGRFADAFQAGDIEGVVALLTDDAWLTMPPEPLEYQGPAAIGRFLSTVPAAGALHRIRLVPTRANLQPAFGCYLRDPQAAIAHAYGLMVLTVERDRVSAMTGFIDSGVFAVFGLPRTIPCDDA
jgi:RNA polymerase sigma-70 factor (ECF subfamily)